MYCFLMEIRKTHSFVGAGKEENAKFKNFPQNFEKKVKFFLLFCV